MKEKFLAILKENTSEMFENLEVTDETKFIEDMGFDSVSLMQLIIELEEEFGIEFIDVNFEQIDTVGNMFDYMQKELERKVNGNEN